MEGPDLEAVKLERAADRRPAGEQPQCGLPAAREALEVERHFGLRSLLARNTTCARSRLSIPISLRERSPILGLEPGHDGAQFALGEDQ